MNNIHSPSSLVAATKTYNNRIFLQQNKYKCPELSRFFGIIIRMYMEAGVQHSTPHFHAYYQQQAAVFGINPVELIAGNFPLRQKRLAEAWAELHQEELQIDWERLQAGKLP